MELNPPLKVLLDLSSLQPFPFPDPSNPSNPSDPSSLSLQPFPFPVPSVPLPLVLCPVIKSASELSLSITEYLNVRLKEKYKYKYFFDVELVEESNRVIITPFSIILDVMEYYEEFKTDLRLMIKNWDNGIIDTKVELIYAEDSGTRIFISKIIIHFVRNENLICYIDFIPKELYDEIFKYLNIKSTMRFLTTNKENRELGDNIFWSNLVRRDFLISDRPLNVVICDYNFGSIYLGLHRIKGNKKISKVYQLRSFDLINFIVNRTDEKGSSDILVVSSISKKDIDNLISLEMYEQVETLFRRMKCIFKISNAIWLMNHILTEPYLEEFLTDLLEIKDIQPIKLLINIVNSASHVDFSNKCIISIISHPSNSPDDIVTLLKHLDIFSDNIKWYIWNEYNSTLKIEELEMFLLASKSCIKLNVTIANHEKLRQKYLQ